jgi:hypothetical protein
MFTPNPRPHRAPIERIAALLVATCLTLLAFSVSATASTSQPTATTSSAVHGAVAARAAADRTLARSTHKLAVCVRKHSSQCRADRLAVRASRTRLIRAEQQLHSLTASTASRRHTTSHTPTPPSSTGTQSPTLTVSGQTLTWNAISGVSSYVFVRKVPGKADEYSTVTGTSITPPAVSGATVSFSIRSSVEGSAWAPEVSISYPAGTPVTQPGESTSGAGNGTTEGPTGTTGSIEGTTGTGTGISTGGQVSGTGSTGTFEMGVVAGSALLYELPFIQKLGAHTARTEFEIGTPASQMDSTMEAYARAGVRPLLLASFYGTLPTPAQDQNLATWAAQFGPGGSFWKGKNLPASSAVTDIEFGNETSYAYQYSEDSPSGYATRAQTYALRFAEAQAAIHAANPNVGLLAQGDPGNAPGTSWMDNMFKAVPNLGQIVAGWTVHPYGPNWQSIMDKVVSSAQADGASSSIPLYVTEWGLSTDNGRCLEENYGFNACMTYQEAATTLQSNLSAMRARYGSRLAAFYLFQAHDQDATGTTTKREGYFGALQSNEAPKGAYTTAVESLLSLNP